VGLSARFMACLLPGGPIMLWLGAGSGAEMFR